MRDENPGRYERAAVLGAGLSLEARDVSLGALDRAVARFDALPDRPDDGIERVAALCAEHQVAPRDHARGRLVIVCTSNRQPSYLGFSTQPSPAGQDGHWGAQNDGGVGMGSA